MYNLNKSVLITGGSSGIGYAIRLYLAKQGYTVLATVRKDSDVANLKKLGFKNLEPLYPSDLTNHLTVLFSLLDFVREQVKNNAFPALYAIINVAGGGQISPVELMIFPILEMNLKSGLLDLFPCCRIYFLYCGKLKEEFLDCHSWFISCSLFS